MTQWKTTRKWDASKIEIEFEKVLNENGFKVKGIRECTSLTDYLIEKDGIETEYRIYLLKGLSVKSVFNSFLTSYKIKEENQKVKAEYEKQAGGN